MSTITKYNSVFFKGVSTVVACFKSVAKIKQNGGCIITY